MLGLNLRQLSSHLQELKLTGVILDREFLCPLDGNGKPALPLVEWPYLEVLVYHEMPNFLPSGEQAMHLSIVLFKPNVTPFPRLY